MKLRATIASMVTSMVKLMTRMRPTLSDSVPRMMRPAVLKMATGDTGAGGGGPVHPGQLNAHVFQ